ncbi:MAG: hypothetical protein EZS28_042009 [Streblomastix strix]|uniref:Uncharacterized protein n=1 Tax=Streblomastix strix TaxID=222440 RepID=A0A5J4TW16_9EUKA|nr:MAG: hypothetical protein EZS28_042009 [Streblomastix strix]
MDRTQFDAWNLQKDQKFLEDLSHFAGFMLDQSKQLSVELDDVKRDVDAVSVISSDIFNKFHLLSNEKFIENRVYEDPQVSADQPVEDKDPFANFTKEQRDSLLIQIYTEAIKSAMDICSSSFNSNYDTNNIYSQNKYERRPLPQFIGDPQYESDPNVGMNLDIQFTYEDDVDDMNRLLFNSDQENKQNINNQNISGKDSQIPIPPPPIDFGSEFELDSNGELRKKQVITPESLSDDDEDDDEDEELIDKDGDNEDDFLGNLNKNKKKQGKSDKKQDKDQFGDENEFSEELEEIVLVQIEFNVRV